MAGVVNNESQLEVQLGDDDPMLADYEKRLAAGIELPIDRANRAVEKADASYPIAAEHSQDKRFIERTRERVFRAARTVALAEKAENEGLADCAARQAESEALVLAAFDSANLKKDGLRREVVA